MGRAGLALAMSLGPTFGKQENGPSERLPLAGGAFTGGWLSGVLASAVAVVGVAAGFVRLTCRALPDMLDAEGGWAAFTAWPHRRVFKGPAGPTWRQQVHAFQGFKHDLQTCRNTQFFALHCPRWNAKQ